MDRPTAWRRDIFLQPGGFHFGGGNTCIRTVLGSCIAITLWHPALRQGGMCHFMLPQRAHVDQDGSGRYADGALILFLRALQQNHTHPCEYEAKLFGGGHMFTARVSNR